MTTDHEILGFTTADLVAAMLDAGIHTSVDRFKRLAAEIQRRGFAERDKREITLDRMADNAAELGLTYEGETK
jgi:hypothetical protein